MKRFYTLVSTRKTEGGYEIHLDGRPVKTPLKNLLRVPNEDLASLLVREWAAQEGSIIPDTMPITQIVSTRIDRVPNERAAMSAALFKYMDTDLLCYRTDDPPELGEMQAQSWDRWLTWFADRFGSALETTFTIRALKHPEEAHKAVQDYVKNLDDNRFTVFQLVTPLSGSIILALAFVEGAITPEELFDATHVEEYHKAQIYDEEKYGPDPMQEKKDIALRRDLEAAHTFLQNL
jgi:chaperone required for assembly of F1-ATPase